MSGKALQRGDRGQAVTDLQHALIRALPRFYPTLIADGELGPTTRFAFEAVGYALGMTGETLARHEITVGAQRIVGDPASRDAGQLARSAERAPKLAQHTVAFDGTPTFWGLAKPLLRAREHGWSGTLQSSDRRQGIAEQYGKRSQAALFHCFEQSRTLHRCPVECAGNCNAANRPGQSSHELRSDGSAFGKRGAGAALAWWELGLDTSDTAELLHVLGLLGYDARLTYPGNPHEAHHINFDADPGPVMPPSGPHAHAHAATAATRTPVLAGSGA